MEQAERLDGLNPDVRKARLRLLISLATRHLQQKKIHLAEPELRQIEALPQAQQGDRPAMAAALRWVYWTLGGDAAQADAARAAVVRVLGSEAAAHILLKAVAGACKLKQEPALSSRSSLVASAGRGLRAGLRAELKTPVGRLRSRAALSEQIDARTVDEGGASADAAGLAGARRSGIARRRTYSLAYAVSAAGPQTRTGKMGGVSVPARAGLAGLGRRAPGVSALPPPANWRAGNAMPTCCAESEIGARRRCSCSTANRPMLAMTTEQIDAADSSVSVRESIFPDMTGR